MIMKQRPFCDPELAVAVNSALMRKVNLDQFVELQRSPSLNLGGAQRRRTVPVEQVQLLLSYSMTYRLQW